MDEDNASTVASEQSSGPPSRGRPITDGMGYSVECEGEGRDQRRGGDGGSGGVNEEKHASVRQKRDCCLFLLLDCRRL